MSFLTFTTPLADLQPRGYTFQKLYAGDHKVYRKNIGEMSLWCWVSERRLEIEDWYGNTGSIIEAFKKFRDTARESKTFPGMAWVTLHLNRKTGEVKLFDKAEYYGSMTEELAEAYQKKYEGWREVVLEVHSFDKVVEEVNALTK